MGQAILTLDWDAVVHTAVTQRKREGISQRELADLAGITQPTVWKFEKGERHIRLDNALAILNVLGLLTPTRDVDDASEPDALAA